MTDDDIVAKLEPIFATVLDIPLESIGDDLAAETCDPWDSMHHIHLVNAIEEEFGIVLDFEQQMQMVTFARVRTIVGDVIAQSAP